MILLSFALAGYACDEDVDLGATDDDTATDTDDDDTDDGDDDTGDDTADPVDDDDDGLSNEVEELFDMETRSADSDQDGIADGLEFVGENGDPLDLNISPQTEARSRTLDASEVVTDAIDSDQDGLGRIFENNNGLDDSDPDVDNDGYSDALELIAESNPFDSGSRPVRQAPPADDGVARELTDPPDDDRDGLSNTFEGFIASDSNDRDTDDDGFSDGIEYLMGSSPLSELVIPNFTVPDAP